MSRRSLSRLGALAAFFTFAVWAIWSEVAPSRVVHATPATPGVPDASWRQDPLWDDGMAEFCAYEVTWPRYGRTYAGRALLVLVKESWNPELDVKADEPLPAGFEVLKLNHLRDVATGIYTYHQMASVFLKRDDASLVKAAATSSEACGISTAHLLDGFLSTRSYFDGQGDRRQRYPAGALLEDGLPALLRDYVAGTPPSTLELFPTLMAGRFPPLAAARFALSRRPAGEVEVPAGRFPAVELTLEGGDRRLTYLFEEEAPHRLLRFAGSGGTEYRLARCDRLVYWKMQAPGEEAWLPPEVR
jgi:hypothetical protein